MTNDDKKAFAELMAMLCEYYQKTVSALAMKIYWDGLQAYPLAAVEDAIRAHITDEKAGKWMPLVADLTAQIRRTDPGDGHPGPDEAWGIVAKIMSSEAETAALTEEMREGWAACSPVMDLGDEVGARMTFREVYTRAVARSRAASQSPKWSMTLGTSPELRQLGIEAAIKAGRISQERGAALLPGLAAPKAQSALPAPSGAAAGDAGSVPASGVWIDAMSDPAPLPGRSTTLRNMAASRYLREQVAGIMARANAQAAAEEAARLERIEAERRALDEFKAEVLARAGVSAAEADAAAARQAAGFVEDGGEGRAAA